MHCSQLSVGGDRFDRRAFCKAVGIATAGGAVEASLGSVLAHADLTKEQRDKMTPDEVIQHMKAGNERFLSHHFDDPLRHRCAPHRAHAPESQRYR